MSQFSRRAGWLNFLFPASVAPQKRDPGQRSDDVSLVQPYDASGWPIPDPSTWIIRLDSAVGATGDTDILTVPDDSVYRLFSANAFRLLGVNAIFQLFIVDLNAIPILSALVANEVSTGLNSGNNIVPLDRAMVIPGGLTLRFQHFGGDAATQIRYHIYGCLVPAGTVFYC